MGWNVFASDGSQKTSQDNTLHAPVSISNPSTDQLLKYNNSSGEWENFSPPTARLYLDANTASASSETWRTVSASTPSWITTTTHDVGGMEDNANDRLAIPEDGVYLLTWQVTYGTASNTTVQVTSRLLLNGTDNIANGNTQDSNGNAKLNMISRGSVHHPLSAGDYIDLQWYWAYSGGPGTGSFSVVGGSDSLTWISAAWVGPTA